MTPSRFIPKTQEAWIALLALIGIGLHLAFRLLSVQETLWLQFPLGCVLVLGGIPLVLELLLKLTRAEFGSDLLAGLSIVVSVILGEYLAGSLVVLMLSGGETLESYAVRSASSVLKALASRMPSQAHRREAGNLVDIGLADVKIGDELVVLPHETCPVDGTVIEGHGVMDESYLTGEPYEMSKTPGTAVLSGAVNGETALTIRADRLVEDSRYAKIMQVMRESEQQRPQLRRLADRLGAWYTPAAIAVALLAWLISGEPIRFLAVLVVATPCPLLIAIPVAIIGSISLAAKRAIIIRDPAVLEVVDQCRTMIFDKTGTLTYGAPQLVQQHVAEGLDQNEVFVRVASLEQYSKHPLAKAVLDAARAQGLNLLQVTELQEKPGQGMTARIGDREIRITSRQQLFKEQPQAQDLIPPAVGGLECVVMLDGQYAALYQFRDQPRPEGRPFIHHLHGKHLFSKTMLVSGDRESEVQYLADLVGINEIRAGQSPEQKVEIVRQETLRQPTIFIGDGINDAPALMTATVGIAFGQNSDVTVEAADAVIMDSSIEKVDEFLHISRRMRQIALQSAVGGMGVSIACMGVAAAGYLPPVSGAVAQELIDVVAVLNALRVAVMPKQLRDYQIESR
jgi:heavy metal translocating P-type ATPase